MLFHWDFYAFLANRGDYDRAGLCGEGCCAVDGGGGAEGLAIYAIEADCLIVVEAGDGDEAVGWLDCDATVFYWFNTYGPFDSLECSESAPRLCCFISLDCRCRDMKCSIFNIRIAESISFCRWYCFRITIDIFDLIAARVFRSDWLPIICS